MHAQAGNAKFVILSGDLIAHNFSCKFAAVFPKAAPADYRAFVEKTIVYVMANLRPPFPEFRSMRRWGITIPTAATINSTPIAHS